jgi:hypothetical protein
MLVRAADATHVYTGMDLSRLSGALKPAVVVTAADLARSRQNAMATTLIAGRSPSSGKVARSRVPDGAYACGLHERIAPAPGSENTGACRYLKSDRTPSADLWHGKMLCARILRSSE